MLGRPVTGQPAGTRAGQAGPTRCGVGQVAGVDGDATGGVAEGSIQQPVHATLPCWGAALVAWWACQQASSSAWMAAWVARATSRRRASGCPKGALAERAIGERVGPVDLGEEHAVGEEAVGAEHRGAWSGSFLVVA
jgi:hypothetical protein